MNKRDLIFLGAGVLAGRATRKKTTPAIGAVQKNRKPLDGMRREFYGAADYIVGISEIAKRTPDKKMKELAAQLKKTIDDLYDHLETKYEWD